MSRRFFFDVLSDGSMLLILFAALRAEHPELAGQTGCRARLLWRAGDTVRWEMVSPR